MRFRRSGVNWEGRTWFTSPALNALMDEIEAEFPDPAAEDGTVASRGHDRVSPGSDHRPRPTNVSPGVVNAVDAGETVEDDGITLAEAIRTSRDRRVRYVIHENRMFSSYARGGVAAWTWRPYSGPSPHTSHVHVSVDRDPNLYNDGSPFGLFNENEVIDVAFSKGLTEGQWRTLYQAGVAKGSSEQAVVDYWTDPARTTAEHEAASAAMFVELTGQQSGAHDHDGRYVKDVNVTR